MVRPLRTEFVIADGARARWVRRAAEADDFRTVRELLAERPEPARPQGVAFEGSTGRPANIEPSHDVVEKRRTGFAEEVAAAVNAEVARDGFERLAIVAPARMLNAIRAQLSDQAACRLVHTLDKDLTHVSDHELGKWLRPLELN